MFTNRPFQSFARRAICLFAAVLIVSSGLTVGAVGLVQLERDAVAALQSQA
ncbi:MAG TPA: hypothetical protein VF161_03495 [Steroidobacteraceae bacterium]|jgi:hypothetical protein